MSVFRVPDEAALKAIQDRLKPTRSNVLADDSPAKQAKYRSRKVVIDGNTFPSKKEGSRWQQLRLLEQQGAIQELKRQVRFVLAPAVKILGRNRPPLRYYADFVYLRAGVQVVEDTKGVITETYRIKRHLMATVHGIEIQET